MGPGSRTGLDCARVVKVSAAERDIVIEVLGLSATGATIPMRMRSVANRLGSVVMCVTDGANGASLLVGEEIVSGAPPRVDIADAVGAGDALAAALLDGLLGGRSPSMVLRRALALGAIVASRSGATPPWSLGELDAVEAATPGPIPAEVVTGSGDPRTDEEQRAADRAGPLRPGARYRRPHRHLTSPLDGSAAAPTSRSNGPGRAPVG